MTDKKTMYILSGLGADERVFEDLDFLNFTPYFIKWEPITTDFTIEEYAKQLINQIEDKQPRLLSVLQIRLIF